MLVSSLVRAVLRKRGYRVTPATTPEVLGLLRGPEPFTGILVTNLPAPFLEFADDLRFLFLSSSPDPRTEALVPSCRVVRKPFVAEELVRAVEELEGPWHYPAAGLDYCFAGACLRTCSKYCST
jgi:hypothetical protein